VLPELCSSLLKSSHLQGIIIVEKTQMSEQYFPAVQKFTVLDLGMVLLPVASQSEASCLIIHLVSTRLLLYNIPEVQKMLNLPQIQT
jgi:hypothetical protein